MRYAFAAAALATTAFASWSPDAGSHGGNWGEHGAPAESAGAWDSYTTEVVTSTEIYCPKATEITTGGTTYSVTEATTLTIPEYTVTKPVSSAPVEETPYSPVTTSEVESTPVAPTPYSSVAVSVPVESAPVESAPVYSAPAESSPVAPVPVYPTGNGTVPAPAPSGSAGYSATEGSPIPEQTGNSASTISAGAAGILAVFGLVAAL